MWLQGFQETCSHSKHVYRPGRLTAMPLSVQATYNVCRTCFMSTLALAVFRGSDPRCALEGRTRCIDLGSLRHDCQCEFVLRYVSCWCLPGPKPLLGAVLTLSDDGVLCMIPRALRTCNDEFVLKVRNLQAHGLAHLVRLACHKRLQPRASSSSSSVCKPISIQPFQLYSVCKAWVNADMALMPTASHRKRAQRKPPMLMLPFFSTITWGHLTGEQCVLLHALLSALTACVTATPAAKP